MRFVALALCTVLASACGPFVYRIDVQQGNYLTEDLVAKLKPGMTKAEVRQVLGTPLLNDVFHADRWDYYYSNVKGRTSHDRKLFTALFKDDKLVSFGGDTQPAALAPVGQGAVPAGSMPPRPEPPPQAPAPQPRSAPPRR